ncbi:MAG: NTP transferase domain-containing protein [Clostridia bacterium]|nr:NTP transferase domain-containing protein [Clostridia bacterium]
MIGIILAGGDGRRLKDSFNNDCCKPLVTVNNKKLIEYALENLIELDINMAYIVVGKKSDMIIKTIGNEYKNLKIRYVYQPEQKGLINAVVQALNDMTCDETVVLQLSDEIFIDLKTETIKRNIESGDYDFYCGVTIEEDPQKIKSNFSVEIDDSLNIKKCTEKPLVVTNDLKGTGFCVFNNTMLQMLKSHYNDENNTPYDLCDYINWLIKENKKGLALPVAKREFNINTLENLIEAQNYFMAI